MSNSLSIGIILAAFPAVAFAAVDVTEIAWMGTAESQYGEWIELYNNGTDSVSLDGWKLYQDGGSALLFSLTKTIPAGGYLVVERTTPSVPDPLPAISDEAGTFGGSGLANTGEHLVLKDASGTTVLELPFQAGWPAGDAATKETMQKKGSGWITAAPTPKAATVDVGTNTNTEHVDDENTPETETSKTNTISGGGSTEPKIIWKPNISFIYPKQAFTGVPVRITATVTEESGVTRAGHFVWNMGEGRVIEQQLLEPVTYTYQYPGEYVITLAYTRREAITSDAELVGQFSLSVTNPVLTLERDSAGALFIKNTSTENIDLYQWKLLFAGNQYEFPRYSIVKAKNRLPVSGALVGVASFSELPTLANPSSIAVAGPQAITVASVPKTRSVAGVQFQKSVALPEPAVTASEQPLAANALGAVSTTQNNKRTWGVLALGALAAIAIALFLLLERFKAHEE
ncbi:MAG TPA: lamin tail domain-containing protein [Candidatus Paceibacterota bacterium]|nr:lamin tail domain-containing protein [Candidatus Paceibacterota bacterium]